MKILTLAAGFAAGYVLGTKAGREKYEQIAATARKVSSHPTVVQAQEKAKNLMLTGDAPGTPAAVKRTGSSRRRSTATASDPLT